MFLLVFVLVVILESCAFKVSPPEKKPFALPQMPSSPPVAQVVKVSPPAGRFFSAFGCGSFLPLVFMPRVWSCAVLMVTSGVLSSPDLKSPLSLEPEAKTFAPPSGTIFSVIYVFFFFLVLFSFCLCSYLFFTVLFRSFSELMVNLVFM